MLVFWIRTLFLIIENSLFSTLKFLIRLYHPLSPVPFEIIFRMGNFCCELCPRIFFAGSVRHYPLCHLKSFFAWEFFVWLCPRIFFAGCCAPLSPVPFGIIFRVENFYCDCAPAYFCLFCAPLPAEFTVRLSCLLLEIASVGNFGNCQEQVNILYTISLVQV